MCYDTASRVPVELCLSLFHRSSVEDPTDDSWAKLRVLHGLHMCEYVVPCMIATNTCRQCCRPITWPKLQGFGDTGTSA